MMVKQKKDLIALKIIAGLLETPTDEEHRLFDRQVEEGAANIKEAACLYLAQRMPMFNFC